MKKRLPFIIAALLATFWIFNNSMQTADLSSVSSGRFVSVLSMIMSKFGLASNKDILEVIVRKIAHVAEFTLQGILIAACFGMPYRRRIIYILFFGLLTACCDEYIQYFTPGRGSLLQDVFIDFGGTVIGTVIMGISYKFKRR